MDPIAHLAGCCYLNHPTEGEEPGHWGVTGQHLTEKQSGNALFKIVHVGSECLFILVLVLDVLVTSLRHQQEGHGGPFKDQIAKRKLQRILGGKNMPPIPWAPRPLFVLRRRLLVPRTVWVPVLDWMKKTTGFCTWNYSDPGDLVSHEPWVFCWFKVEMRSGKPNWGWVKTPKYLVNPKIAGIYGCSSH